MGELDGKAVVVTGSGRGLGRAYALAAAREGAAVVVNDVDADAADAVGAEILEAGGVAVVSHDSVVDADAGDGLVGLCVASFGGLDGVVNNAGLLDHRPAWELDIETMQRLVGVNILGVFIVGVAAMRRMREQGRGVIVNVTSGAVVGMEGLSLYGATKGAVASAVYGWARDLEGTGVRVLGFSPLASTGMGGFALGSGGGPAPELVAPAMTYLLSDASEGLSGQIFRFDGRRLGVLGPPRFGTPVAERGEWDASAIGAAIDEHLRPQLEHLPPSREASPPTT